MKRRRVLQSLAALPAAALPRLSVAQTPPPPAVPAPVEVALPKLSVTALDAVAPPVTHYFSADQMAALQQLAAVVIPSGGGNPGAVEAEAPQFLDFLMSRSPADRQTLYKQGLDRLNRDARARFGKPFAELNATQAAELLKLMREPWPYEEPTDPFARFLGTAKQDLLLATVNSRQWAEAPTRGRGGSGIGMYWFPIE